MSDDMTDDRRQRPPSEPRRVEDLRGGHDPSGSGIELDPAELAEYIPRP